MRMGRTDHSAIGEHTLQQGAKDEAKRLFRLAAASRPKHFDERSAAGAERSARRNKAEPGLPTSP